MPPTVDDFIARKYQEEVFTQAQQSNVIAALDTGSGKTYISTLLVKWVTTLETSKGKVVVFLVPKVPLVEQQGEFIAKHSSLRVLKLHGAMELDLSDRAKWQNKFEQSDVFVMTAQMLLNFLTHSIWSINKISLMVFDECHHARKNHPYNSIMREYMLLRPQDRPKIFGMTASPIWNPKDAIGSLTTLEANMNARVIGVRQHSEELLEHSPKPVETIKLYAPPPEEYDYPSPSLWMSLSVFSIFRTATLDVAWPDIARRYHVTLYNLGPYCASLYLFIEMSHCIKTLFIEHRDRIEKGNADLVVQSTSTAEEIPSELIDIAEVLWDYEPYFVHADDPSILPMAIPLEWCTPKVKTLVEVLLAHQSPTFQGIVFVEQRQVAACLAMVLPHIAELNGIVRCGNFVGQGSNATERVSKDLGNVTDVVKSFKEKVINLLIATSVAEEGLDFPACDVVIRFDPLQHLVGYVQSRGRARNKTSNFIVMIQKDDFSYLARYEAFIAAEPQLKNIYQESNHENPATLDEEDEDVDAADLATRERYVVPTTSAFVNYDNAIALLNHLCALIPHDLYTTPIPIYTGDFQSTLQLPASLPLSSHDLTYVGPLKHSKREAKRAVAFLAVKRLRELDVFDDYLLPAASSKKRAAEDLEGRPIRDMSDVPKIIDAMVRDPWIMTSTLWIHPVYVDDVLIAGIVTGTQLPPVRLRHAGCLVGTAPGRVLELTPSDEVHELKMMEDYTRRGVSLRVSASKFKARLSHFFVPVTADMKVDLDEIERLVTKPRGRADWNSVGEEHYGRTLVDNPNQYGRAYMLHRVRHDLTPMSVFTTPSGESQTYYDYYIQKWTRKNWEPIVPTDGPMIEVSRYTRAPFTGYLETENASTSPQAPVNGTVGTVLLPQGCCTWVDMSETMIRAFGFLAPVSHRLTDIYRAREAKRRFGLPAIRDELMVHALTIPSANATFSNQRLETLGDAVLGLCTTVHLFNKFPHRHEGQLTALRKSGVSNLFLLARALDVGLDQFVNCEHHRTRIWRYVLSDEIQTVRYVKRQYPRRSLQDCMEAILGAAFLTGGISMALYAGTVLGLVFGGTSPWFMKYDMVDSVPVSPLFLKLQRDLGYTFRNGRLLKEAVTHPSFASIADTNSYQRLEFLGDSILNLVVIHYLYEKYPTASSHQLAHPRSKAICAQALASLAVRKLGLHKIMLVNSVDLSVAIGEYVPHLESATPETIVKNGWRYDPPKALSDVFESVIGAVLVDSGYDYEKTASIVEFVMDDILTILSPAVPRDPISLVVQWLAASQCNEKPEFVIALKGTREGMEFRLHNTRIAGPVVSSSFTVAKNLVSERALSILQDPSHENTLTTVCTCAHALIKRDPSHDDSISVDALVGVDAPDNET